MLTTPHPALLAHKALEDLEAVPLLTVVLDVAKAYSYLAARVAASIVSGVRRALRPLKISLSARRALLAPSITDSATPPVVRVLRAYTLRTLAVRFASNARFTSLPINLVKVHVSHVLKVLKPQTLAHVSVDQRARQGSLAASRALQELG